GLADLEWLQTPVEKPYVRSAHHNYVVKVENRDEFTAFLQQKGIATSMHYIPNHLYAMYEPYRVSLPVTESVWKRIVTMPLFPDLTNEQVDYIIECVRQFGSRL
ncbi:MAG: DegT/DnrJ/EryC1/StrS family aminotransferase, partial [Chloroflexota bacterium]